MELEFTGFSEIIIKVHIENSISNLIFNYKYHNDTSHG